MLQNMYRRAVQSQKQNSKTQTCERSAKALGKCPFKVDNKDTRAIFMHISVFVVALSNFPSNINLPKVNNTYVRR